MEAVDAHMHHGQQQNAPESVHVRLVVVSIVPNSW